jgi:protein-S-isoprenylcysteine O-methyltransferase Ste14
MAVSTHASADVEKRLAANSVIVLSFIVALEFVIMISPFAFVFYAALNPFLLVLNHSETARWLTAFFLPHMIVPPNLPLKIVRVLGSVFFLVGMAVFLLCAVQVYGGKLFKLGVASRGLYAIVRHPQYMALAVAALGLALMWPRFLTLVLYAIMLWLYYLLARDEERRMLDRFGDSYRAYLERTGMFLPRRVERLFRPVHTLRPSLTVPKVVMMLLALLITCVGAGFLLRAYTVHHLPLARVGGIDVMTITPEDLGSAKELVGSVLEDPAVASRLASSRADDGGRVLAYFLPIDYVMQGMIADTGEQWKLFQHHKTIRLISEYIIHPFSHLTGGHAHSAPTAGHTPSMHNNPMMKRRIIFVAISGDNQKPLSSAYDDFGINAQRSPLCFVDVHLHTGEILQTVELHEGSGWGRVPTPTF